MYLWVDTSEVHTSKHLFWRIIWGGMGRRRMNEMGQPPSWKVTSPCFSVDKKLFLVWPDFKLWLNLLCTTWMHTAVLMLLRAPNVPWTLGLLLGTMELSWETQAQLCLVFCLSSIIDNVDSHHSCWAMYQLIESWPDVALAGIMCLCTPICEYW